VEYDRPLFPLETHLARLTWPRSDAARPGAS